MSNPDLLPVVLVSVGPEVAALVRERPLALALQLGISVPEGWPVFPHAFREDNFSAEALSARGSWGGFLFIDRKRRALVGNGGFKGAPDIAGEVEIGYEVAPAFRRSGYATQATRELLRRAFLSDAVRCVNAHTLASSVESAGVLRKSGFQLVSEKLDDQYGTIWKWSRSRTVPINAP